jgi:hypothetical protein
MARRFDTPHDESIAHFRAHGWMRVPGAFDADAAAAMRNAVWDLLATAGIERDRPASWTVERPAHLQRLKGDPVFDAVGSAALFAAIDAVLEGRPYDKPRDWGAAFIAFPTGAPWGVPTRGWHIDANYMSPLWPARGVKTFALLGDVVPHGGGTLLVGGSHRLVHEWFRDNPPPPGARSADMRRLLLAHPYIRDLHGEGGADARSARFMDRDETIDGVTLRVTETVGAAGDVFLVHPLVMHVAAANEATAPRFLLSGGITTDMWGWGE